MMRCRPGALSAPAHGAHAPDGDAGCGASVNNTVIIWGRIEEGTAYRHGIDRLTVGLALLLPVIARSAVNASQKGEGVEDRDPLQYCMGHCRVGSACDRAHAQ